MSLLTLPRALSIKYGIPLTAILSPGTPKEEALLSNMMGGSNDGGDEEMLERTNEIKLPLSCIVILFLWETVRKTLGGGITKTGPLRRDLGLIRVAIG